MQGLAASASAFAGLLAPRGSREDEDGETTRESKRYPCVVHSMDAMDQPGGPLLPLKDSPIETVADTAFWVATYRADEGLRPDALFSDPLAERLVAGRGRAIAAAMPGGAFTGWLVAIRTRIIDAFVQDAIAAGCEIVLNLGAGLDTRPYRMLLPVGLGWIEVDFASTIDFKAERLADEIPRCNLERRKVDLSDADARRALLADVDATSQRVLVLTEGVIPYLSNADVAALAEDLQRCPHMERWILEYLTPVSVGLRRLVSSARVGKLARAPFQFAPKDWTAFFGGRGWRARDVRYLAEEGDRLGRTPAIPSWMKLALALMPKRARIEARRHFGYAVLERS